MWDSRLGRLALSFERSGERSSTPCSPPGHFPRKQPPTPRSAIEPGRSQADKNCQGVRRILARNSQRKAVKYEPKFDFALKIMELSELWPVPR
jgi:hypothetical protein